MILEHEPENEGVNKDLKEARRAHNDKLDREPAKIEEVTESVQSTQATETKPKKEGKFKRVMIEEDSSDEEEPTIEDVSGGPTPTVVRKETTKIDSKFPLRTLKEQEAHSREAKQLMKQGGIKFKELFDAHEKKRKEDLAKKKPKKEEKIDQTPEAYDSVLKTIEK
jgi:hypothetical protein